MNHICKTCGQSLPGSPASFGDFIGQRRGRTGMREAAKEIGISPATLSRAERGLPLDGKSLARIALWVGYDAGVLLEAYLKLEGKKS